MADVLEIRGLNQYYGDSHTLWDLDMTIPAGSCTVLMGRNGAGKTTLLKSIMGLQPLRSGQITYGRHALHALPAEARARLRIGYVPQGREIFPQLTVEENLHVAALTRGRRDLPERVFELFPVLKKMLRRRGGDLSGGQQQQLAIGRALVLEPSLIILDEPCEGIQPNVVHEIGDVIMRLNREEKMTVLLVEQKLPFAHRVGEHFVLMEKGRAVASGMLADLSPELIARHLAV